MSEIPERPRLRPVEAFPVEVDGKQGFALRDPHKYAPGTVFLTPPAFFIAALFDGRHDAEDICGLFTRKFGDDLPPETIRRLAHELDESYFLDSPRFRSMRSQMIRMYHEATRRPAVLAGASYPTDPAQIRTAIDELLAPPGAGPETAPPAEGELRGLLVPHIELKRGRDAYAHGYRLLRERAGSFDRVVILGVSHFGESGAPYTMTVKDFETPLGILEADREFIQAIEERTGPHLYEDEMAFRHEHSMEFPVLLLQHLFGSTPPFRIVPVICGSYQEQIRAGVTPESDPHVDGFLKALRETIAASPGRTLLLGSVDLSHVGPRFGDPARAEGDLLKRIEAADRACLEPAARIDAEGFYRSLASIGDRYRACGLAAIYSFLRTVDADRGTLLSYGQSPEAETGSVVTFPAMAFTK